MRWATVVFKGYNKQYSYLCDIENVKRGDFLLVKVGDWPQVVKCIKTYDSNPPIVASQKILKIL